MFRGPRQSRRVKIIKISGGRGGRGGGGGMNGGSGGAGEGPRMKMYVGDAVLSLSAQALLKRDSLSGRTVMNISQNYCAAPPAVLSGFRTIPFGDIDLQREIQLDHDSGVVTARRLHSARIEGSDVARAVAMYQGDNAEERIKFWEVSDYFLTAFHRRLLDDACTFFIRRSTGQLCLDIVPGSRSLVYLVPRSLLTLRGLESLAGEDSKGAVIDLLTLEQYHAIPYYELSVYRIATISSSATANIGGVYHCPSDNTIDDVVEIAWLPNAEVWSPSFWYSCGSGSSFGELVADGWTCLKSTDIVDTKTRVEFSTNDDAFWLSQANHIFTALQISSDFQNHGEA
ncbi:hypothetical protein C8R45DRAFT_1206575, partial [Mycena sanguinolenta]